MKMKMKANTLKRIRVSMTEIEDEGGVVMHKTFTRLTSLTK